MNTTNSPLNVPLPRRHRVLIALYALELGRQPYDDILRANDVTEQDLAEFHGEWQRMRRNRKPTPATL